MTKALLRVALLATALLVAACSSMPAGGDPREVHWNTLWPTPPDPAYWGSWKSGEDRWLQIEGSGEGFLFRGEPSKESHWVKTALRVVKPTWGSGWDLVTETGARYRAQSSGDGLLAVSGPDGDQRYQRAAALPEEVAAAVSFRQAETETAAPAFSTDEESDWWWPF